MPAKRTTTKPADKSKSTPKVKPKAKPKPKTKAKVTATKPKSKVTTKSKTVARKTPAKRPVKRQRRYVTPDVTKPVLKTAKALRTKIEEYFEWCRKNPWNKVVGYDREGNLLSLPRPRPFLTPGLCNFIGISKRHWYALQDKNDPKNTYREDLADVIEWANNEMYQHNVTGAVVDDYKENIVARITQIPNQTEVSNRRTPSGEVDPIQIKIENEVEQGASMVVKKLLKDIED